MKVFHRVNDILNNIKYERSSPAKVDDYIAAFMEIGDNPTMPATFCISRWLDRDRAVSDVIGHFDTLEKYYKDAKIPRNSTIEDKESSECETLSNESLDEE